MKREALDQAADLLTTMREKMRAAKNDADLRQCAGMLDGPGVLALPERAQEDLFALYAETHRRITGGLHP